MIPVLTTHDTGRVHVVSGAVRSSLLVVAAPWGEAEGAMGNLAVDVMWRSSIAAYR